MPSGGVETPIPESMFARLASATRYVISGAGPASWFGPLQPLAPQAPAEVKGRQWDYPFGVNINYIPRSESALSFDNLRSLADALPLLRAVIETRKDQIAALNWTIRARDPRNAEAAARRCESARAFFVTPDRRHDFATWLRILIEDMLVIDAACVYPRYTRSGALYSLDVIDGANIKPLIGEDGRSPEAPGAAYQQVLHGVPAADFSADELLYLPRNVRSHRLYGMSPVEQIALTINIALRREQATLEYYNTGSIPDSFATLPKDWTVDQIRQFQDYFDALMSGNLARRRMVKFMPADFKLTETRQSPLKDQYDEWLARVICYAFSVPASAFITQVNRATSQTLRTQAAQEGLVPLKAWVKRALDRVVQVCLKQPDLEFAWVGDDAVDPLQQAQTIAILVNAGIKTRDEARAELGLAGAKGVAKFNSYHDELGRFTTGDGAGGASDNQVAANEYGPTTDVGGGGARQRVAIGGTPMFEAPAVEPARPIEVAPMKPVPTSPEPATPAIAEPPPKQEPSSSPPASWSNPTTLAEHFAKHGADFGATDSSSYAQKASEFYSRSLTAGYLRKVDIDGTIRIYDPATRAGSDQSVSYPQALK